MRVLGADAPSSVRSQAIRPLTTNVWRSKPYIANTAGIIGPNRIGTQQLIKRLTVRSGTMGETSPEPAKSVPRLSTRTNLFLAAALRVAGSVHSVKIRDMSDMGAQIEGLQLPEAGTSISLIRGRLAVEGQVAWRAGRRCGVRFLTVVSVRDWMANPANVEQQRVDHIVDAFRGGAVPFIPPHIRDESAAEQFSDDLVRVANLLERLGDALASDEKVVLTHGMALQKLDVATQMLLALAQVAPATDSPNHDSKLESLRASCNQALRGAEETP